MGARLLAAFALLCFLSISTNPTLAAPGAGRGIALPEWNRSDWWRGCASLDLDFYNDRYYINGNTTCDGTTGTQYSGVANFIAGVGATFTRAGTTNVTDINPPFYLNTTTQSFVSRASVTNNVTAYTTPFYIGTTGNGPSQSFVSRASVGTYFNSSGTLQTQPSGSGVSAARSAAYYYNGSSWVLGGTLIEPTATNGIRNNTMSGAVAGTPGTPPTNWHFNGSNTGTLTENIIGTGQESGINYVDIQYTGTTSGSGCQQTIFDATTAIPASIGQTYTLSVYLKLTSGSITGIAAGSPYLEIDEYNASGAYLVNSTTTVSLPTNAGLSTQHNSGSRTLTNPSTAFVSGLLAFCYPPSTTLNLTLRIGMPQMELGSSATSLIATSGSAVTRAADIYNQQPASYFDSTGTLYFSAANTARTNYYYSSGSWVLGGTLIEPAATNGTRNNTMVGAVAADGIERTNNGTLSNTSPNICTGSLTSTGSTFECGSASITPIAITSLTNSGTTATATTGTTANNLAVGDVVSVTGASLAAYNGTFIVSAVGTYTFSYVMTSTPSGSATGASYVATNYESWAATLNGGTGTVTASAGSISLTGDGTNAASIYEAIPTTSGYFYNFTVTTGSGNAVTVQAGTTAGGAGLVASTSVAANSTVTFQIYTSSGSVSYIQINNTSTTAATVTAVSVQSGGTLPTDWSFQNGVGMAYSVAGIGTENGVSYIDIKTTGTPTTGGSLGAFFDTANSASASNGQTWTSSGYLKLQSGSLTNVTFIGFGIQWFSSALSYLGGNFTFFTPTASSLSTQRQSNTTTLNNSQIAYVHGLVTYYLSTGNSYNFTLRIGMPQLEQSSYATSVIPTYGSAVTRTADVYSNPNGGTYFNSSGVLTNAAVNTPRLDHNPISPYSPRGILIEENRTNLITYSVPDSGTNWTYAADNTVGAGGAAASPDGGTYAASLADNSTSGLHCATPTATISVSSGTTYNFSVFVKPSTATDVQLALPVPPFSSLLGGAAAYANFNLTSGTVVSGTTSNAAIQALSNGWYRLSLFGTAASTGSTTPLVCLTNNSTTGGAEPSYSGSGESLYIWGAQFEAGQNPTSYIPTYGSTVARATDVFTVPGTAGAGWLSNNVGTLGTEGTILNLNGSSQGFAGLDNGSASQSVINQVGGNGNRGSAFYSSGQTYLGTVSGYTTGAMTKIAFAFSSTYENGAADGTGYTSGTTAPPATQSRLTIGHTRGTSSGDLDGWITRIWYMPVNVCDNCLEDFTR